MGDYRIYNDMDAEDIMDCLSDAEKLDFVYECYEYLSVFNRGDFIERLGAQEVIFHLGDEAIIKKLKERGYKITGDGSEV